MANSIKAACVMGALAMGLLGASTAAKACGDGISSCKKGDPNPGRGGAPSPEVNTLVGFLVVAGTVVFVKRWRGTKAEAEDATV